MKNNKCKICRRLGMKLFLKGDRCLSPKCAMITRPFPPGEKKKRRFSNLSDYAKELREKQRLKNWYNLREKQFRKYVKEILDKKEKTEDAGSLLIKKLESRLDNIVFRSGFAPSRVQARQLVSHGHFMINDRAVDIPSYEVKKGDKIKVHPGSKDNMAFKDILVRLKNYQVPSWLSFDKEKLTITVDDLAKLEEVNPPAEISSIFEFYSR